MGIRNSLGFVLVAGLAASGAACNSDSVAAPQTSAGEFTVNASTGWVYVSLRDSAVVVTEAAGDDPAWDIAFFATNVMLNGGAAGPGGVTGYCVCQNAAATEQEILAMTAESEVADYAAVSLSPAAELFTAESLLPAFRDWYSGAAPNVSPSQGAFELRLADGTSFAKLRIIGVSNSSATTAGQVSLQFALQAAGATSYGTSQSLTVDLATGPKSIDLNTGQVTTSANDWDIRFDGYSVRVNSGVSGSGTAGAFSTTTPYDEIEAATAPSVAYAADRYAGVFGEYPWYRYNILGDNRISPTFDVYLVRRGSTIWKLQLLGYYSATNASRHISFRYESLSN